MKILFIVNPVAGGGQAGKVWKEKGNEIIASFPESKAIFTEKPGDAKEISREAVKEGYEAVVSCGGDGTLNEVVNGIIGSGLSLGLLPLGTGSDFGKTVGIRDLGSAIKTIKDNRTMRIDAGMVEFANGGKRYFINSVEAGFGADVMNYVDSHRRLGSSSFIIGVLASIVRLRRFDAEISVDYRPEKKRTIEIIVANGRYFGGGMLASPESRPDDNILDIHILKPIGRLQTIFQLRELINGTYIEKGHSYEFKGKNIEINAENILIEMDGEVVGKTPVKISVIPGAINLIIP